MRVVVLAAGYATRLYPLTKDFPKPLLEVQGATILDRLVDQLEPLQAISTHVVVNRKFEKHFRDWGRCSLIVNESTGEHDRAGAVADLNLALEHVGTTNDVLVVAADTIFNFPILEMIEYFRTEGRSTICVWPNADPSDQRRRGNARLDTDGFVERFVEKPETALSEWSSAPIYVLRSASLGHIGTFLDQNGNADAPGHLIEHLAGVERLAAFKLASQPVDIGTPEALQRARSSFASADSDELP